MSDDQEPTADLDELAKLAARAERAWRTFEATGGLLTIADIAERWGVGKQTVRNHMQRETFPEPVATVGLSEVWTAASIDLWRATPRKRGPKPAHRRT